MTVRAARPGTLAVLSDLRTRIETRLAPAAPAPDGVDGAGPPGPKPRPPVDLRSLLSSTSSTGPDRLLPFRQAILAIRIATTTISVALALGSIAHLELNVSVWCVVIVAYNGARVFQPIRFTNDNASVSRVVLEVGITACAVVGTGYWSSPFAFSLLTTVAVAGFAAGFGFAIRIGATSVVAITIPSLILSGVADDGTRFTIQWATEILLVGLIAGYARIVMGEASRAHGLALDRIGRLTDANDLLFSLHQVAQTLPSSLDLDEVLDSTMNRLRDLFRFDAAAVLLYDDTDQHWVVARAEGARTEDRFSSGELPPTLNTVIEQRSHVVQRDLRGGPGHGLASGMASGLYGVLQSRGAVVGLVAIEFAEPDHVTARDIELLGGLVEPAGLAIDNARFFSRIRTVGADEERTRIARDLHDRIAQSLAYLGFELDRIVEADSAGEDLREPLAQLRGDVRSVVGEVRDTLHDLRTDVSDDQDMATTLDDFCNRVKERSGLGVVVDCREEGRLPLRQEREMWRIAQEAITNVERHAGATQLDVRWTCDDRWAELVVHDDGVGFPPGKAGRVDSYGVIGMRERAASIGATLAIFGHPRQGTTVCCQLQELAR